MNNITEEKLTNYIQQNSSNLDSLLDELYRETNLKTLQPNMISGHEQGLLLQFFSRMIKPERVLEIGTFTGFATICLAAGLKENGIIDTIEVNDEMQYFHEKYFSKANLHQQIKVHYGDAREIILKLNAKFDVIFIDADKSSYSLYFDLVIDKVKKGGWIIADNVLWKGKVLEEIFDKKTLAIDSFNKKVRADNRVENLILPIRDGLNLIRKL